ncbi:MAG: sodium:proton antiporter [Hyphomicrobiales bacterium]|nr:MAG: sodium:proton antiporter [Hyphomicrobiales bacterium]
MISAQDFLILSVDISLVMLLLAFLLTIVRIVIGPTLPDRVLALDMLVAVGIGFIAIIGIKTGYFLYIDVAIALGLIGFLATVAFSRYVLNRGTVVDEGGDPEGNYNIIEIEIRQSAQSAQPASAQTVQGDS